MAPLYGEWLIDLKIPQPSCIFIVPLAFQKLKTYIELCPVEISGLGEVELRGDQFLVTDLFLLPQKVSPSETELDPQQLCEFLSQCLVQGKDPASLRVWWHSHGEMDLHWSRTDRETIKAFPGEYLISIVGNKGGQFLCRLDIFAPAPQTIDGLNLVPLEEPGVEAISDPDPLRRAIQSEIREKVKILIPLNRAELEEWAVAFETEYYIEFDPDAFKYDQAQEGV